MILMTLQPSTPSWSPFASRCRHPAFNILQYQQLCTSVGVWAWQHKTTTAYAKPTAATPSLGPTARCDQVLALRAQGMTYHQIAKQTGWSEMKVARIIRDAHPRPGSTDQPPAI